MTISSVQRGTIVWVQAKLLMLLNENPNDPVAVIEKLENDLSKEEQRLYDLISQNQQ